MNRRLGPLRGVKTSRAKGSGIAHLLVHVDALQRTEHTITFVVAKLQLCASFYQVTDPVCRFNRRIVRSRALEVKHVCIRAKGAAYDLVEAALLVIEPQQKHIMGPAEGERGSHPSIIASQTGSG